MVTANPQILVWARETAGYDLVEAAKKLGLKDGKTATAEEKLAAYERGEKAPSRSFLLKMSKQYRRPLLTFYLDSPPTRADRGEDFRTLRRSTNPSKDGIVDALVRNIRVRQGILKEALVSEQDFVSLAFIGSYSIDQGVSGLVSQISDAASFDLNFYRSRRTQEDAFHYLRERIENIGIFSILIGNLGSHHTKLSTELFRGFAIADPIAQFVVINNQDAKTAWPVTLLHEVAHLWLGATGISGDLTERRVEQFCDNVASELLAPEAEIRSEFPVGSLQKFTSAVDAISQFASKRKISPRLIAFRLLSREVITPDFFKRLSAYFYERWRNQREHQRQKDQENAGGPSYYVLKRMQNGNALMSSSERLMRSGELSTTQAAMVLGVRALKLGNLLSQPNAKQTGTSSFLRVLPANRVTVGSN